MAIKYRLVLVVLVSSLLAARVALATEIEVKPGKGTISEALAKAKSGDVVKLSPGDYQDELKVPAGVSVLGSGPDKTKLTGTDYALVNAAGANVTIADIEFRAGEKTLRGVNSDLPVRIERCRFVKLPEAVALMGAPLSDIIACEFNECDMGVRAIGRASPTVWGCRFEGGRQGVFAMDGAPYVRNNLFRNLDEGLRLASGEMPIVRNNVFWKCKTHGVLVMPQGKVVSFTPSIRNNIFVECGDAVSGPAEWVTGVSHAVVFRSGDPPIQVKGEGAKFDLAAHRVVLGDPGLQLGNGGALTIKDSNLTKGKGIHLCQQPASEKGDIGLAEGWTTPGCRTPPDLKLPPVRFIGSVFVANAVVEEYVDIERDGCKMEEQEMAVIDGRRLDTLTITCDGKTTTRKFDIERCFGEYAPAPE